MRDALICEPLRTPVGRFGGMFRDVSVTDLATTVIRALIDRAGVPKDQVDDVMLGQAYANGEATILELVDAQTANTAARNAYDDGQVRYRVALAALKTLTGSF